MFSYSMAPLINILTDLNKNILKILVELKEIRKAVEAQGKAPTAKKGKKLLTE